MKKTLLLLVFLFFGPLFANAQPPCSYVQNEVDPFTGKTIIVTDNFLLHNQDERVEIRFIRLEEDRLMYITLTSSRSVCFKAPTDIIFLDKEGETLELVTLLTGGDFDCGDYLGEGRRRFTFLTDIPEGLLDYTPVAMRFISHRSNITIKEFSGWRILPSDEIMGMARCLDIVQNEPD